MGPCGRVLSLLSLCRRAAKLVLGFDKVVETVKNQGAQGVFLASDVSGKTQKETEFLCDRYKKKITRLPVTMDEIESAVGKRSGVITITDKGLSDKLQSMLAEQGSPEQPAVPNEGGTLLI